MSAIPLGQWDGKELSVVLKETEEDEYDDNEDLRTILNAVVSNPAGGNVLARLMIQLPHRELEKKGSIELFKVTSREDGEDKLKGLGKAMLCAVFKKLKEDRRLYDEDPITLTAVGGFIDNLLAPDPETDISVLEETIGKYRHGDSYLKHKKDAYANPKSYENIVGRKYIQDLILTVTNINQTRKLIEYYGRYGFVVIPGEDYGIHANMTSTVGKILSACSPPKGGKTRRTKKTRKFSRRK